MWQDRKESVHRASHCHPEPRWGFSSLCWCFPDLSGASSPKLLPWKQHSLSISVQLHRSRRGSWEGCRRTKHSPTVVRAHGGNIFHRFLPAEVQEQLLLSRQGQYIRVHVRVHAAMSVSRYGCRHRCRHRYWPDAQDKGTAAVHELLAPHPPF